MSVTCAPVRMHNVQYAQHAAWWCTASVVTLKALATRLASLIGCFKLVTPLPVFVRYATDGNGERRTGLSGRVCNGTNAWYLL